MDERVMSYREKASEYFANHPNGPTPDSLFGPPVVDPELPPFWKPEEEGEKRWGEVYAVRPTKDFGKGEPRGEAIYLRGPAGLFSIPIGANLKLVNWHLMIGMVFLFEFRGWQELEEETRCRKWLVRPLKLGKPSGDPLVKPEDAQDARPGAGGDDDIPF